MGEWGPEAGGHALTALAAAVLGLLAWLDLQTGRIPNAVVYPAVAGAVILSAVWPGISPAMHSSGRPSRAPGPVRSARSRAGDSAAGT